MFNSAELPLRRLLADLQSPVDRRWFAGDAFKSACFNALAMGFPVGEQCCVDVARKALDRLPLLERHKHVNAVEAFIAQEVAHWRIHTLFNEHLAASGFVNRIAARMQKRRENFEMRDLRHALAVMAAHEHLTAAMAQWCFSSPRLFDGVEPRIRDMWLWHAAEELDHSSVMFDLHVASQGDLRQRRRCMRHVQACFTLDLLRQTIANLRRDGALFKRHTWASAARLFLGGDGLLAFVRAQARAYAQHDFHPSTTFDVTKSARWLRAHGAKWTMASASPSTFLL